MPLRAQNATARVFGTVVNSRTQAAVANAEIIDLSDGRSVRTDSTGYYSFENLPSGLVKFMVRAARFPMATFTVALVRAEQLKHDVGVDTAAAKSENSQTLPEVTVSAPQPPSPRFADFDRHRRVGGGQYITREAIDKSDYASISDAMRGLRGVLLDCGGGMGCAVRMDRAPMRCSPNYIVDGRVDNFFGPNTPIRDVEGIEVYTGPSELPGELTGANSGCGLVVIWTRSGPPHKRKP